MSTSATADSAAVITRGLGREFDAGRGKEPRTALADVDLSIERGHTHGLLGPNGAGKTTLTKVLATLLAPSTGTATVFGHDVGREAAAIRPKVAVVLGGERGLYGRVSVKRNLLFWGSLYGVPPQELRRRAGELMERLGLADRADEPVERLSRGMKQRVHLARGLISDPSLLFLDEPSAGLDPVAARELRGFLRELKAEGRTVLLATHDMDEAEELCERVSLIDRGRLLLTSDTADVARLVPRQGRIDFTTHRSDVVEAVRCHPGVAEVTSVGDQAWRVEPRGPQGAADVLRLLLDCGVTSFSTRPPTLEEAYLHVIGSRGLEL